MHLSCKQPSSQRSLPSPQGAKVTQRHPCAALSPRCYLLLSHGESAEQLHHSSHKAFHSSPPARP